MSFHTYLIVLVIARLAVAARKPLDTKPIEQVVEDLGYPLESVSVTTEDGYQLTLHRMRHGYHGQGTNRIPVLLQHGILGTSVIFMATPGCLAYHLADQGFDVWMGNTRGNIYSKGHKCLNYKTEQAYWNFSFHEMGKYDLPAVFKEIRRQTGVEKVHYIGYSMGTTQFLVFGALDPANLDMVGSIVLMAPVARAKGAFGNSMKYGALKFVINGAEFFGSRVVFDFNQNLLENVLLMCNSRKKWVVKMCERIIRRQWTLGEDNLDLENLKSTFVYYGGGASTKTYKHYMQVAKSGIFRQYDYKRQNKYIYHTPGNEPPVYDLKRLPNRMYLIAGGNDAIVDADDLKWLKQQLPNAVIISHSLEKFVHQSFVLGQDLQHSLYRIIDDILLDNMEDLKVFIDKE